MSVDQRVYDAVKEVVDSESVSRDIGYVPRHENKRLSFGNVGLRFMGPGQQSIAPK
jgi:hypothetical protein